MIRCRSFLRGIASISLTAEGLITSLYFATSLQILNDAFESKTGLFGPIIERRQVLRILSQAELDRFINQLRQRPVCLGAL